MENHRTDCRERANSVNVMNLIHFYKTLQSNDKNSKKIIDVDYYSLCGDENLQLILSENKFEKRFKLDVATIIVYL